ncbi:NADPH-dependent FMN reductase [Paracandidimonas soli]|uniref:NADPH-dependent FMN reductase n=1 Tax=Paracandidimonas soli TaxID=1917182 RepID=UPI003342D533
MTPKKIALIVGSARKASINRILAKALVKLADPSLQFQDIRIDDLPIYNGDLEDNRPETVKRFTAEVAACDAVLIVMPEHNRSLPALLKNAIDWGSKPADANVWRDKPAAICGASPGAIGTAVGQQHLRQILGILGATVMGGETYISFKPGLIDDDYQVTNASTREFLSAMLNKFSSLIQKLT